ncbi:phage portal protein [Pseudooceanicola sp. C21-150M6]|uniref:phage portal protein n=1 Tax=Pseudooceanicola sp. C21-150M6 TaxID=3434355 RepID=UPI003D7FAA0F
MAFPFARTIERIWTRPAAPARVRAFEAAAGGRRWSANPSFGRTGPETLAAAGPLRSRARFFYANNGWAQNGVNALVTGLTGTGITPSAQHLDPAVRTEIGAAFAQWAKVADVECRTSLWGLMSAAVRAMIADGEAFLIFEDHPEGLRLRLVPAEMCDESDTVEHANGTYSVAGVHFDAQGRRTGYRFLKSRPTEAFAYSGETTIVPAEDVIHLFAPLAAGQVRGTSWLAPILLRLAEIDGLEDALLVGAKTAALFAGFLVDQNNSGGDPFDGEALPSLEPGTLQRLPGGFDIRFSTPQQAQQTAEFVGHQIRAVSAGLGVPAHLVSNDLREASYGSLRAGMIAFKQRLAQIQFDTIIPQMCDPIFARSVTSLVLRGEIAAPDFEADPAAYLSAEHYPPPMPWLDPAKDADATATMLSLGLLSRRQAVAELGYNVETLDAEIAADRKREAELGLSFGAPPKAERPGEKTDA